MDHMKHLIWIVLVLLISCHNKENNAALKAIHVKEWGEVEGKKVYLYTLTNSKGNSVSITNYGGIITSWLTPDRKGTRANIVIGFDTLTGYLSDHPYFGAIIGRYANRIGDATFTLDNQSYKLAANNGRNHLHGGNKGFDKVVWDVKSTLDSIASLTLVYRSADGEEGYPGNLLVEVVYTFTNEDELLIEYTAQTDKATPVNLTNHSYFNLSGDVRNTILDHQLEIYADAYTPVDSTLIPTGAILPVTGTSFDFTSPHKIGERISEVSGGYDHNFVLNRKGITLEKIALLSDSTSGRKLEVYTTEPGIQFYSGNFLDGTIKANGGHILQKHAALCLETQHFPDSPNKTNFPTVVLKPGEKYKTVTKYRSIL